MSFGADATDRRALIGRLAGALFSVGAIASVFANVFFTDPPVYDRAHAVNLLAFVSGVVCFLVPWRRIGARWFHLVPAVAAAEVALAVWAIGVHGGVYAWYYVLIAVFVAVGFDSRPAIAGHTLVTCGLMFLPMTYAEPPHDALVAALVAVPVQLSVAVVVTALREMLQAREHHLAGLVSSDPLTGVGNLRLLEERLGYELTRHRRTGRSLAILLLDLDRFKEVNDTLGHPVGDALLRDVAEIIARTVRSGDTVVRQGGDEFCVIAPETDAVDAQRLSDRIRQQLGRLSAVDEPLSVSVGVAVSPADGMTPEALMARADLAQRSEKERHRGRRLAVVAS